MTAITCPRCGMLIDSRFPLAHRCTPPRRPSRAAPAASEFFTHQAPDPERPFDEQPTSRVFGTATIHYTDREGKAGTWKIGAMQHDDDTTMREHLERNRPGLKYVSFTFEPDPLGRAGRRLDS